MVETLIERAQKIKDEGLDLGHAIKNFDIAGRNLLINLIHQGLIPQSKVLDIGCGCMRGGYWLIHFLDRGGYFGIDPNEKLVNAGVRHILETGLAEEKLPRFNYNGDFDLAVFGEKFDFMVAFSIWTHCPKEYIQTMLDRFLASSTEKGVFMTTYYRANLLKPEYTGDAWKRRKQGSITFDWARQKWSWIQKECRQRGLVAEQQTSHDFRYLDQTWIKITRG
jgi:cyclopropane fatty-acyl-phospholipid synthase-like methyltransferase